jgi:hypothetical protein
MRTIFTIDSLISVFSRNVDRRTIGPKLLISRNNLSRLPKCPDPKIGAAIPITIGLALADGKPPSLSPEMQHHLEICEGCRQNVPLWYEKGNSARRSAKSYSIVNRWERGDKRILRKTIKDGIAYFEPNLDNPKKGLFVLWDTDNYIDDPEEISLESFQNLE